MGILVFAIKVIATLVFVIVPIVTFSKFSTFRWSISLLLALLLMVGLWYPSPETSEQAYTVAINQMKLIGICGATLAFVFLRDPESQKA